MQHIVISGKIFLVDEGYLDEPLDTIYPVFDLENEEPVLRVEAATLQKIATQVPACYARVYANSITMATLKAKAEIDIRPVLRLMVNNERYIHYVCGPVILSDLYGREGGQYISCDVDAEGKVTLYAAESAIEMIACIRHKIPVEKNGQIVLIHDAYLQEAIELLVNMTKTNDACQKPVTAGTWKDPNKLPKPEERHDHGHHCLWCLSMGLDGKHGNYWANDGIVYDDRTIQTAKSPYIEQV